jgi:predicted enzyme related to lactoylglutathione lyase
MKNRVTGIGGIFFKCEDPKKIKEWYGKHLGLPIDDYGASFRWIDPLSPDAKAPALTAWSPFKGDTTYFKPSEKPFMFNYRVENLVELLEVLKSEGVQIVGAMEEFSYGKFGWVMDPEGNKIELWEPKDEGFDG